MSMATSTRIAVGVVALTIAVLPIKAQPQAGWQVSTSVLEKYVGEYVYPDGETVMIRLRGDTLFREVPGQQVPFVPLSDTLFRLGPVITAEFVIDRAGVVTQILTDGVDIEYRLRRKPARGARSSAPSTPSSAAAAAVHVSTSVLERYVGRYEFVPGQMKRTDLFMVVRLKGDRLTRQMTGGPQTVLTPISETRFRVGDTSLETEFMVDAAGGVTQDMGWGFQRMTAYRKPKR